MFNCLREAFAHSYYHHQDYHHLSACLTRLSSWLLEDIVATLLIAMSFADFSEEFSVAVEDNLQTKRITEEEVTNSISDIMNKRQTVGIKRSSMRYLLNF
jgi:hypothetical protein